MKAVFGLYYCVAVKLSLKINSSPTKRAVCCEQLRYLLKTMVQLQRARRQLAKLNTASLPRRESANSGR